MAPAVFNNVIIRVLLFSIVLNPVHAVAQTTAETTTDKVTLRGDEGSDTFVVEGRIVDWTGEAITIERAVGSPRKYDAARVESVETIWPKGYQTGRERLASGEYRAASESLLDAARAEQRPWARRQTMIALVRAYAGLGDWSQAGDTWLAIIASDPTTSAIDDPPLAWHIVEGLPELTRAKWRDSPQPYAQLLAASHALQTNDRATATARLEILKNDSDPRLAQLATAQLWRTRQAQATAAEVDHWQSQAKDWADERGGGPWLVIAEVRARLEDHDAAMLTALRPVILGEPGSPTAARGLLVAARSAAKSGQTVEAQRLCSELLRDYAENPQRGEAQALLDSLK